MSSFAFEARLALRYLADARGQGAFSLLTALAILGNVFGVAALVIGQAIMLGIESRAQDVLVNQDPHIWLLPGPIENQSKPDESLSLGLTAEDLTALGLIEGFTTQDTSQPDLIPVEDRLLVELKSVAGLVQFRPVIEIDTFYNVGGSFTLGQLRGVSLGELQTLGLSLDEIPASNQWGLIVPSELVFRGQLEMGQRLNLITTQFEASPVGRLPISQDFQVIATYPAGAGAPLLTTLATAQFLLDTPGQASAIEIFVADPYTLDPTLASLEALIDPGILIEGTLIETWQSRSDGALAFVGILRLVLLLILGLIILVSAFNIFTGQLMLTDAQRRAIAIMRSFGASKGEILRIFLFSGLMIGLLGTCVGLGLGTLVAANFPLLIDLGIPGLSFFAHSPPQIRPGDLVFAFLISIILALIASIVPARAAAQIPPVEAFRYG